MDVPTRQAYVVAVVDPSERTAAAAYTNTARYMTRPSRRCSPAPSGPLGAPFLIAGALKSSTTSASTSSSARVPALCLGLAGQAGAAGTASGAGLRFHTEVVKDPMSNGIEAFRMLIPNGWARRGGVVWNLRYSNVASVAMTVGDARSHEELQVFPLIPQVFAPDRFLGPAGRTTSAWRCGGR